MRKNCRFLAFFIFLFASLSFLMAQEITVTGVVHDNEGETLPGVSVVVKGSTHGTVTDIDGNFEIKVAQGATLEFSYVGFHPQEIRITNQKHINVTLNASATELGEVVVVGYGTVKRRDLTGSIASVKKEDINAFAAANPLLTLSGRVSGVQVKQSNGHPGEDVSVRIRGTNSIRGDNEPLYIIDGTPASPYIINNADIESIEVLKDASATAIYGSRGANGVIIITTKGGRPGKTRIEYDYKRVYQIIRKKLELLNASEYMEMYDMMNPDYFPDVEKPKYLAQETDWQDFVFRTALMNDHTISVSGGDSKTSFIVSMNVFDQDGIIRNSNYKRYSVRPRISHKINEKLSFNFQGIFTRQIQSNQNSSGGRLGSTLMSSYSSAPPVLKPYDDDGSMVYFGSEYPFVSPAIVNPAKYLDGSSNVKRTNVVNLNADVKYIILNGLDLTVRGRVNTNDARTDVFYSSIYTEDGQANVNTSQSLNLLNENILTYNKKYGKHSFNGLAGFTYENTIYTSLGASGSKFLSDVLESHYLQSAEVPGVPSSNYSEYGILSYLGRINYSFKNRYLLTASFRADGSSKFVEGHKWGYFPSAALAWRAKEELFLKDVKAIDDLKIRTSWGKTGSQAIGAYATQSLLAVSTAVFSNEAKQMAMSPSTVYPFPLKWETTEQCDVGLDLVLFRDRVRFTTDYYIKNTRDLLNLVQLPTSTGYKTSTQNIGKIRNRGVEFDLQTEPLNKNVKWTLGGNISFNRITVVGLHGGEDILTGDINLNILRDNIVLLREGEPLGVFYGYLEDGYTDLGRVKYKDIDGDGTLTGSDKVIIGDPNPKYTYGFNSTVSYKGFDVSLFFQGVYGNKLANLSKLQNTFEFGYLTNLVKDIYRNTWTPENPNAKYPRIQGGTPTLWFSDRFIEDGSYMRLKDVEIAYTFKNLFSSISNVRIYLSGQNLITLTKYTWHDPEVNSKGGSNSVVQGVDLHTYPMAKSITMGAMISF